MLTNSSETAASRRFVQSSNQPSEVLRWLGNAAIAFATLAGFALAPATVSAQEAEPTHQPGCRVALIDVAYILKNLPAIKAQINKVKSDLKKEEAEFRQKRNALKKSVERLHTLKRGTADYVRQEEHVANLESTLRLDRIHKHSELSDAEAKIYYDNYQQIVAAVRAIATLNDVKLVLRYDSEDMAPEQNVLLVRGATRNVVYHDGTLNMTNTVLRYLEERSNTSQSATSGNASGQPPTTDRLESLRQMNSAELAALTESLIKSLNSENADVRRMASRELYWVAYYVPFQADSGNASICNALIDALGDENKWVRFDVVRILGLMGPKAETAIPNLVTVLMFDERGFVRSAAAGSLCKIGPAAKVAIPVLLATMKDSRQDVRAASALAMRALSDIRD